MMIAMTTTTPPLIAAGKIHGMDDMTVVGFSVGGVSSGREQVEAHCHNIPIYSSFVHSNSES